MLDLLISTAHAQSAPGGPSPGGQGFEMLLFFGSIIAIWWFLVIRPQTKSAQKHAAMVAALKKGDQVVTASGIFGKVASVEEGVAVLEISKGVKIRVVRDKVARHVIEPDGSADSADQSKKN